MSKVSDLFMMAAMISVSDTPTIGFPRIKLKKKYPLLTDAERDEHKHKQVKGKGAPAAKRKGTRKQRKQRRAKQCD